MKKIKTTVAESWMAAEWDYEGNDRNPSDVLVTSRDEFSWVCPKGHKWKTTPKCRRANKSGCHCCAGKLISSDRNLGTDYPELLGEWDSDKNSKSPFLYFPHSSIKVWWKCSNGHSWKAKILHRTRGGSGCPVCKSGHQSSRLEIRIFSEIKYLFPDAVNRFLVDGVECDIFIPGLNVGVEVDGWYWHSLKEDKDKKKNDFLNERGIDLIRVRECPLERIRENDVLHKKNESEIEILKRLLDGIYLITGKKVLIDELNNDEEYRKLLRSMTPIVSFRDVFPKKSLDWNYDKNSPITPEDVYPRSTMVVWWKCSKCGEEYEKAVWKRASCGCPFCSGKRVYEGNSLQLIRPDIAKEWDYEKNDGVTPRDVTFGSHKVFWWKCSECGFEYNRSVNSLTSSKSKKRRCGCEV